MMIQIIEELSLNAWASLQTILLDGWVLRFANGYTRRANSILALYPSSQPVMDKIAYCEYIYHTKNQPVVFKLPGKQRSNELDTILDQRGYQFDANTSVQTVDLKNWDPSISTQNEITLSIDQDEMWQSSFERMHHLDEKKLSTHRQILNLIVPQKCYASIKSDNQIVGCALGVLQTGYLGIFDVIVDDRLRRQGYAYKLMCALLSWGKAQGAHTSYLQVMLNNPPALNLYTRLGFKEVYQYWYRVLA